MSEDKGLTHKYDVRKADTGEVVENCFVLRPDKDPAAVAALRAYAESTDNAALAADIINWIGLEPNKPLTINELEQMDGEPVYVASTIGEYPMWYLVDLEENELKSLWDRIPIDCFTQDFHLSAYLRKPKELKDV